MTIRHCGTAADDAELAAMARAGLEASEATIDLLCYCHQSTGPVWEAPCAKLRAELGLASLFPLAFGQSGCLSFPHAFTMAEWLFAAGRHRGALYVIAERPEAEEADAEGVQGFRVAIVEASVERGAYRVVRGAGAAPPLELATRRLASGPFLALKGREPMLAAGDVAALAFRDGSESHTIQLRKQ